MLVSAVALAVVAQAGAFDPGPSPLLMRTPTVNATTIVFEFGGDLWSVPRTGGQAVRLTSSVGTESSPAFSPDGKTLAFSGQYDGNTDVFVMPANGGVPKRLTAHPGQDLVSGWTPDGKSVLFASGMLSNTPAPRLFTVPATGGMPKALPLPMGLFGSLSPDGSQVAYVPGFKWQDAWKRYRGGQASTIWIAKLSDSSWKEIPRKNEENFEPMWVGDKVYYLSDKKGIVGLYSYAVGSGKVTEEVPGEGFDLKSADAGGGVIVYEKLGSIWLYDPATRKANRVPIEISGDFREVRPEIKNLAENLQDAWPSPSGQRLAVMARGMLFSVPATKGETRLMAGGEGIDRRDPSWSPNGKSIAYFTDENRKQELAILDVATGKTRLLTPGEPPAFYDRLIWSPDSNKIAYTDRRHNLWIMDVASGASTKVDTGTYEDPYVNLTPSWSPDSAWITWARDLDNHLQAVFLYSLADKKKVQITDGMSNAKSPVFDRNGKYIYFYASTTSGQSLSWLDLSSFNQPNSVSSVYAVVLDEDAPSPLQPESDEELDKPAPGGPPAGKAPAAPTAPKTKIDLARIEDRIIALPMPAADYQGLEPGPANSFFALALAPRTLPTEGSFLGTLWKFDFGSRIAIPFAQGVNGFRPTADGSKLMLRSGPRISLVSAMAPPAPGQGTVDLSNVRTRIDPRKEWERMYNLVWRNEKLLFYDANLHGIDADEMDRRYQPFLANIISREQLNYLFTDMLGEMSVGHMFIDGGDMKEGTPPVPGGLLGIDYAFENNRYRITRIYTGERWNPALRSPLAQPGIKAKEGDYILGINGQDINQLHDIYELLEGKAGKQVRIKIGSKPTGEDAREVVVVPVASEGGLRNRAWIETNRKRVAEATDGQIGYVHVPDTANGGWTEFVRYYYAQSDRKGIIIDERFNGGGLIVDSLIDELVKPLRGVFTPRDGKDWPTPGLAIHGPKVMLVNQFAGSGGDMFPWLFRQAKVGPLIGKRTWGGLVAAFGFALPDGGSVRSPNCAFYNPFSGTWDVEGWGVSPDIDVELDPFLWRQGKDAQLERGIEEIKKMMKTFKYPSYKRPAPADRTKLDVRH